MCYETHQALLPYVQYSIAFLSPMNNDGWHNRLLPQMFEIFGHAIDTTWFGTRFFILMKMHFYKSDISMKLFRCWNLDLQGSFYRDKLHCTNNRILQKVHVIEYCTTKLCVLICSLHYIFIIIKKAIFHFLFFHFIYIGKRKKYFKLRLWKSRLKLFEMSIAILFSFTSILG